MTTPSCKPILLLEQANFCIVQCQHCQRIGLTFQNLLLGFKQDEFIALCQTIEQVQFDQSSTLMTNGQSYLIINTGHPDIQFSLSQPEFDRFQTGLAQALRRMNLHQLLKFQSN